MSGDLATGARHVTCAVGAEGLVACLDTSLGQHGFALKPSGNVMI